MDGIRYVAFPDPQQKATVRVLANKADELEADLAAHDHDAVYLRLDASNDPLTGAMAIQAPGTPRFDFFGTVSQFVMAVSGAFPLTFWTNGVARAQVAAAGDVRVYNSLRVGSTAVPTKTLDVTGTGGFSGNVTLGPGSPRFIGRTSTAADPTTTELPADKDFGLHKNTASGAVFLAYNDGGVVKKVALT